MKLPKSPLKWTILLAATAVAIYLCWLILRPFLNVIGWSAVLTIVFHPVHQRLVKRTGRPSLSALISILLVALIILIPIVFLTGLAVNEVLRLRETVESKFRDGFDLKDVPLMRQTMDWLTRYANLDATKLADSIRQQTRELAQTVARYSLAVIGNVTGLIVSFVFTIFAMFFLFRDGERIVAWVPDFLPLERSRSQALVTRIRDVIQGSIYGVLVIAIIQGLLGGVMLGILGVPSAVLWGVAISAASLIPVFGTASVWVPAAIYLLVTGQLGKGIILAAFGALVISSVDNFLRPKLVGDRVRLNELVMFFSVLGGLQVFGILGIVAGPVVFAIAGSLIDTLRHAESMDAADQSPATARPAPGALPKVT